MLWYGPLASKGYFEDATTLIAYTPCSIVQTSNSKATTHKCNFYINFQMVHEASLLLIVLLQTMNIHAPNFEMTL